MSINLKDIKQSFFIEYKKGWIIFLILLSLYLLNRVRSYFYDTDNILLNVQDAVYVSNGVAINNKYILTTKNSIYDSCIGKISGKMGELFVLTKDIAFPVNIVSNNNTLNLTILKLTSKRDYMKSYAILQMDQPTYNKNRRVIIPQSYNVPGKFNFKKARIMGNYNDDFLISVKTFSRDETLIGAPVFSKNYVMQGIIKEKNISSKNITRQDKILDKLSIQKQYIVDNLSSIKDFLKANQIEYSVITGNGKINTNKYNYKDAMVNVVCIKPR